MASRMSEAMVPFGQALRDLFRGVMSSPVMVHRDDGLTESLPIEVFQRGEKDLSSLERTALKMCLSPVLDVGAGSGTHSLILQSRGLRVTALDICPDAIEIMKERGVEDPRHGDVFSFRDGPFSTLLLLGRSLGMVETLPGLVGLLTHAHTLLAAGGQILCDALDMRTASNPRHAAYQEANRRAGRYAGEVRTCFEYRGLRGPWCGWLHVDPDTLAYHARQAGFEYDTVRRDESGDYLACLTRAS